MNTSKIVALIKAGKEQRAFTRLYQLYPKVERHICANSGSRDEAQDIFQEALIILYNKIEETSSNEQVSIEGYLINTSKLLWRNELRKKKVRQKSSSDGLDGMAYHDEIEAQITKESKFKTLENVFQQLGAKCKTILELFYYKNFSMEKIAKKFGYKAVQSAKAKKYKCMEHARKLARKISNTTTDPLSEGHQNF